MLTEENLSNFSITVKSLRTRNEGAEIAVGVVIQNGENSETRVLPISVEQYRTLNLRRGAITEECFEELERASRLCGAIRCGENLLSYGANSEKMLAVKIARHGFAREDALAAAEHLREIGLINEEADMRREVEKCLRKLWGASRIKAHLWEKGFSSETVNALETLLADIDFSKACAEMIRKHYGGAPQSSEEARRQTAALYRYGYRSEEIRRAWKLLEE